MKKNIYLVLCIAVIAVFAAGCRAAVYTAHSGHEDVSYLQFVSSSISGKTVQVTLDGDTSFPAKVNKEKKSYSKPDLYTIKPGKRSVRVEVGGRIIYDQDIFVSQQSTKVIRL